VDEYQIRWESYRKIWGARRRWRKAASLIYATP